MLAGHNVAMVTYCVTKMTTICSPLIGLFFDTMILVSSDKEWLCDWARKFITHSKLCVVFSLCHIALLNSRNKYCSSFLICDKGTHHDEFDGGLPELSEQWHIQHAKQSTDLRVNSYIWIMWCQNDQRRNKPIHRAPET